MSAASLTAVLSGSCASSSCSTRWPSSCLQGLRGGMQHQCKLAAQVRCGLAASQAANWPCRPRVAISSNCLVSSRRHGHGPCAQHGQRCARASMRCGASSSTTARLSEQLHGSWSRSPALLGRKPANTKPRRRCAPRNACRAERRRDAARTRQRHHAQAGRTHGCYQPRAGVADGGRAGIADIGHALAAAAAAAPCRQRLRTRCAGARPAVFSMP
jgi:hypothetical protein